MSLYSDLWAGTGEFVDGGTKVLVSTGQVLGGATLAVASEGAKGISYTANKIGVTSDEKHEATVDLLNQTQQFGIGAAAAGGSGLVESVVERKTFDERIEESNNLWDVFFQDSADQLGDGLFAGTVLSDIERTGEQPTLSELEKNREIVAGFEDEMLAITFAFIPIAKFPKLRIAISLMGALAFKTVMEAVLSGITLVPSVVSSLLSVNPDLLPEGDGAEDEDDETEETSPEDESETLVEEDPIEEKPIEEADETEDSQEEIEDQNVVKEDGKPYYSTQGLDYSNEFVDREIFY